MNPIKPNTKIRILSPEHQIKVQELAKDAGFSLDFIFARNFWVCFCDNLATKWSLGDAFPEANEIQIDAQQERSNHITPEELRTLSRAYPELGDKFRAAANEIENMSQENESMKQGLYCVADLIDNSNGVAGLHKNGDIAEWGELREGGRFEEWLIDFDVALEDISDET